MKKQFFLFILWINLILVLFIQSSWAQQVPRPVEDIDLDAFIQQLFPVQEEDINYEDLYEVLFQRYRNPLNLNRANRDDLQSLFILSELQINNFLKYRAENGKLISIYELQTIPAFDPITIQKLLPFVNVEEDAVQAQPLLQRIASEKNRYLLIRYNQIPETRRGFTDQATPNQRYLGSPGRFYSRFRVSHAQDFSIGFTLEKDDGEQFIWDPDTRRYGMDFISYHAYFQNKGKFRTIALGDYQIQIGQGLLLSGGFSVGKGAETVKTVRRSNIGILPYTSVLETNFLRGGAFTYKMGAFDVTGFYSRIRRDGNVQTDLDSLNLDRLVATDTSGLGTSGFHRTQSEILEKGVFLEQTTGANILFNNRERSLQVGATFLYTHYDNPVRLSNSGRKDSIRNQFRFEGQTNYNLGVNFSYNWRNFAFFGEAARSRSTGVAGLVGFVSSLSPSVEFSMLFRHYDRDFHSFFGSAFGESSINTNERGIYWGIKITPIQKKLILAAYYDRFSFPWLRFRVDAPSDGYEVLARATYNFSRRTSFYAQFRQEARDRNVSTSNSSEAFAPILEGLRRNYLINLDYRAEKIFRFRSRVQFSTFDFDGRTSRGYALVQDLGLDFGKVRFDTRFALFDTDDFDNRQYVYERNVLWTFSIPAYNGQGVRTYFLVRYKAAKNIDLWLRYARFDFLDRDQIGSGGDQIDGDTRSEITGQIRLKF